jgi:hypothetical protein
MTATHPDTLRCIPSYYIPAMTEQSPLPIVESDQPAQQNTSPEELDSSPAVSVPANCVNIEDTIYSILGIYDVLQHKCENVDEMINDKVADQLQYDSLARYLTQRTGFMQSLGHQLEPLLKNQELINIIVDRIAVDPTLRTNIIERMQETLRRDIDVNATCRLQAAKDSIKHEIALEYSTRLAEMTAGREALREGIGSYLFGDTVKEQVETVVSAELHDITASLTRLHEQVEAKQTAIANYYEAILDSGRLRISDLDIQLPYSLFGDLPTWAESLLLQLEAANNVPRRITQRTKALTVGLLESTVLPATDTRPPGNRLYVTGNNGLIVPLRELLGVHMVTPANRATGMTTHALFANHLLSSLLNDHPRHPYTRRNLFLRYYPDLSAALRSEIGEQARTMCNAGATNLEMLKAFHFCMERREGERPRAISNQPIEAPQDFEY